MKPLLPPPLSLYIHLPWCVRKCPYCDFNSHELAGELPQTQYVDALLTDLERDLPTVWGRTISSVFIGGGTPSLFSPDSIDRLMNGIRARLTLHPDLEVTLEANPGTVEHGPWAEYLAVGVNRVSFGVQSFDDSKLAKLGRVHRSAEAADALLAASAAGIENINIDLMFGLPQQTVSEAVADVTQALAFEPQHISHYQLTLEPNTVFAKYPPRLPSDDLRWEMQSRCHDMLLAADFLQYEVSAFARPGRECQHNLNYWRFGDYLGIGAGAHSKVTDGASQSVSRAEKTKHPQRYLDKLGQGTAVAQTRVLNAQDLMFEFALNALRLKQGFTVQQFEQTTGLDWVRDQAPWDQAIASGLLNVEPNISPSEKGWSFLNDLMELFLPQC